MTEYVIIVVLSVKTMSDNLVDAEETGIPTSGGKEVASYSFRKYSPIIHFSTENDFPSKDPLLG